MEVRPARPGIAPDAVFVVVLGTGLASAASWWNDPGTPWHIRLGREILADRAVPRSDTLTWTKAGTPWVDQSWLFDVGLAAVVNLGGMGLAIGLAVLATAWIYRAIARWAEAEGISTISAAGASVLAAGIGAVHFLVRPHLITFALFAWTLHACRSHHLRGGRLIWTVPFAVAVWANCHGGFLAGPIVVATALVGHALSGPMDAARKRRVGEFAAVLVLSGLATLLTPYGPALHVHVARLLFTSGVTTIIDEYQPPRFGTAKARVLELVLLLLVAIPSLTRGKISRYDLAIGLPWLHFTLGAIRQAPLFGLAIVPAVGLLFDSGFGRNGPTTPSEPNPSRRPPWFPIVVSAIVLGAIGMGWKPARLDPARWPIAGLAALNREPSTAPLFHEQDWGGLIEAETTPRRKAFLDDRFELYGLDSILAYLAALEGGPGWDAFPERAAIGLVWVRPSRPLATRLVADPAWEVVHRDEGSILLRRKPATRQAVESPGPSG